MLEGKPGVKKLEDEKSSWKDIRAVDSNKQGIVAEQESAVLVV